MSLPNYLANIKSSGTYRFVWDKSQVPAQEASTLRLVVGYSDKGPFNTPVYVESANDFVSIFGNISKRLERRGVYFHRSAIQALSAGPILAINLKPFTQEKLEYLTVDASEINGEGVSPSETAVTTVFDTTRFWALDPAVMVEKLADEKYLTIAATDTKENSCSIFVRKYVPGSYKGITLRTWYATQALEVPEWAESILDTQIDDYFAEVYVFRGEITSELYNNNGPLHKYIVGGKVNKNYTNAFGEESDALAAMATDSNSNFVGSYAGILLPGFKDANGNYISLDIKFNADNNKHKMLMRLDETKLEEASDVVSKLAIPAVEDPKDEVIEPVYIEGYTYTTIASNVKDIYSACKTILKGEGMYKGIREALTNRVDVEYHYIVDTFDSEVSPTTNGVGQEITLVETKAELFKIAQLKDNAFVIANTPKMTKFNRIGSNNTQINIGTNFAEALECVKNYLPTEVDGASYGAYYTQLTFSDGTIKTVAPSAALVSNLFMEKWGARQPYYIVAGPTFGRLSYSGLVGPDFNFGRSDLDVLEPMGINAIVYVPRKGTYINSNQTAKQIPVSGLSKVHIRELVIYLQNEIESLLQSYQWELNTQALRDTIRSKADAICETIKNNGGLYAFKNVCDDTNNTSEIIDNEMIILDTEIEPARGAGKMVHQLTIHKTGGLTSSVK